MFDFFNKTFEVSGFDVFIWCFVFFLLCSLILVINDLSIIHRDLKDIDKLSKYDELEKENEHLKQSIKILKKRK